MQFSVFSSLCCLTGLNSGPNLTPWFHSKPGHGKTSVEMGLRLPNAASNSGTGLRRGKPRLYVIVVIAIAYARAAAARVA
jgi:hypothetical protein